MELQKQIDSPGTCRPSQLFFVAAPLELQEVCTVLYDIVLGASGYRAQERNSYIRITRGH